MCSFSKPTMLLGGLNGCHERSRCAPRNSGSPERRPGSPRPRARRGARCCAGGAAPRCHRSGRFLHPNKRTRTWIPDFMIHLMILRLKDVEIFFEVDIFPPKALQLNRKSPASVQRLGAGRPFLPQGPQAVLLRLW